MNHYPGSILELIDNFTKLPGIGKKTAERLAMHILKMPYQDASKLANSIIKLKESIKLCSDCFALSDNDLCSICSNPLRDSSIICVVENPADMAAIEKSGAFNGVYHILQGVLSPMDGIGPDEIRINELFLRINKNSVKELILATGTNVEGEATASYIAKRLANHNIKITRIASGVPIGGDLKYIDQFTLKKAMENRHDL